MTKLGDAELREMFNALLLETGERPHNLVMAFAARVRDAAYGHAAEVCDELDMTAIVGDNDAQDCAIAIRHLTTQHKE